MTDANKDTFCPDFCNHRHADLKEWIMSEFKVVFERMGAADKALILESGNLKEHLRNLNGAFEQRDRDRELFVTKDRYEDRHDVIMAMVGETQKNMVILQTRYDNRITFAGIISALSFVIACLGVMIPWLIHKTP